DVGLAKRNAVDGGGEVGETDAAWRRNLDDLGAQLGQQTGRRGERIRQLEGQDPHARQRTVPSLRPWRPLRPTGLRRHGQQLTARSWPVHGSGLWSVTNSS